MDLNINKKIKDLHKIFNHCNFYLFLIDLNRVMEPTLPKGVKPLLDANGNQKLDKNGIYN